MEKDGPKLRRGHFHAVVCLKRIDPKRHSSFEVMFIYRSSLQLLSARTQSRQIICKATHSLTRAYRHRLTTVPTAQTSRQQWHTGRHYSSQVDTAETNLTTKQKLKSFMKKYGPVGVGVYLSLSAVDLGLTMAAITVTGAERVKQVEDWALTNIKGFFGIEHKHALKDKTEEKPSMASIFLIAYGIHKTVLLPFRLGLTAAITPFLAKKLRQMGFRVAGAPKVPKAK